MASFLSLGLDLKSHRIGQSLLLYGDCFDWLARLPENSIDAIVTDPPYGVKEFDAHELEKRASGKGGVWRIPPSFDGSIRAPLPRFTAHSELELKRLSKFFEDWSRLIFRALRPGGHVFVATSSVVAALLYEAVRKGGLEFRGQIMRTVRTLRGGDRPKNAHEEFPDVCVIPKGRYEPWGLFRKPLLPGMTVADCLREFQTGGLRRLANGNPFEDSVRANGHQLGKNKSVLIRALSRRALCGCLCMPLCHRNWGGCRYVHGRRIDYCGRGSRWGSSIGVERNAEYFKLAVRRFLALRR